MHGFGEAISLDTRAAIRHCLVNVLECGERMSSQLRMRQVVDWSAAFWAGLIAGLVFLLLTLFVLPYAVGGNAWVMLRMIASLVLGDGILAPPATFDAAALVVGVVLHLVLSVALTLLLALIIHRWGLLVGIIGGALFGLAVYSINMFTFTLFVPWFYQMHSTAFAIIHVVFGALAGFIYEWLEVEEFEPVDGEVAR